MAKRRRKHQKSGIPQRGGRPHPEAHDSRPAEIFGGDAAAYLEALGSDDQERLALRIAGEGNPEAARALEGAAAIAREMGSTGSNDSMWGRDGWDPEIGEMLGVRKDDTLESMTVPGIGKYLPEDIAVDFRVQQEMIRSSPPMSKVRGAAVARALEILVIAYRQAKGDEADATARLKVLNAKRVEIEAEIVAEYVRRSGGRRATEYDALRALGLR